jgi:hypothetical protein
MKTFVSFFIVVTLLFSCSSPEKRAQKAIKEDLRLSLHDFKSYEPVQFGKLEIANSSVEDLPEYNLCIAMADSFLKQGREYNDKADMYDSDYSRDKYWEYSELSRSTLDSSQKYIDKAKSMELHFVPKVSGWKMAHSFRARTLEGNYKLDQYEFYFDKGITKVIKSVDLSEQ